MVNLLEDTLVALKHFNKFQTEVDAVVFFNEDLNKLQKFTWYEFKLFADDVLYDPFGLEDVGMRVFKSRFFVCGDDWFLARSTEKENYEGWVFYDHQLEANLDDLEEVTFEDDVLGFLIADIPVPYSEYLNDDAAMDTWPKPYDLDGLMIFRVIHGVNGRAYWSDHAEHNKAPQLLYDPMIVNMVIAGEHRNPDVFTNANLSQIIGVQDARYIDHPVGDLTVSNVPVGHFTVYMADDGNEVVQHTVEAPYYTV